jgi:excisionase family DNA binding protein
MTRPGDDEAPRRVHRPATPAATRRPVRRARRRPHRKRDARRNARMRRHDRCAHGEVRGRPRGITKRGPVKPRRDASAYLRARRCVRRCSRPHLLLAAQKHHLEARWLAQRGLDPDIDNVLLAMAYAARRRHESAANGKELGEPTATSTPLEKLLLTTADAAEPIGITTRAVRRAIAQHHLRARRFGDCWQITHTDAERYRKRRAAK